MDHELRTTLVRSLLSEEDLGEIGQLVRQGRRYFLQPLQQTGALDRSLTTSNAAFSEAELGRICSLLSTEGISCSVR